MLNFQNASDIFQAVDRLGVNVMLSAEGGGNQRLYRVTVPVDGMDAADLRGVMEAIEGAVSDVRPVVNGSYLEVT